jgi:hypothetical protein
MNKYSEIADLYKRYRKALNQFTPMPEPPRVVVSDEVWNEYEAQYKAWVKERDQNIIYNRNAGLSEEIASIKAALLNALPKPEIVFVMPDGVGIAKVYAGLEYMDDRIGTSAYALVIEGYPEPFETICSQTRTV